MAAECDRAAALADPTRFAAYQEVRRADHPLTVAEVTSAVGVHHTTVRAHLARLCAAGLVEESLAAPAGRGRPKLLYTVPKDASVAVLGTTGPDSGRLVPRSRSALDRDPYRELSTMLATAVREGRSPRAVGADTGRDVALAVDPAGERDVVDLIQDEAAALGFEPVRRGRVDRPDLVLRHCPFADVAAQDPDSICALHLGIAEGIASACGGVEVVDMVVRDPHRAGCRLRLRRVDPAVPGNRRGGLP